MKVIEVHETHIFLVDDDGTSTGRSREICCDEYSDDYLCGYSEESEPREATAEEIAEYASKHAPHTSEQPAVGGIERLTPWTTAEIRRRRNREELNT